LEILIVHWAASGGMIDVLEWAWDQAMHGWWCWIMPACCMAWSLACVEMALRGWSYLGQSCHLLCWGKWVQSCCRMV
jgi:hypothetical protein